MKKVGDILGFFLILQSFATFYYSLSLQNNFIKYSGIVGSVGVILTELIFLYYIWRRK